MQPTAFAFEETGSPLDIGSLASAFDTADPSDTGAPDLKGALAAGSTGAGIGAALGTVIPGLGNVAGGAIGFAAGAGFSMLGQVLPKKKKAAPPKKPAPWQQQVVNTARAHPQNAYAAADALLLAAPGFDYLAAMKAGRLPSQVAATDAGRQRAAKLEQTHGDAIRKQLAAYAPEERAMIGAALTAGLGKEAHDVITRMRAQRKEAEEREQAEQESQALRTQLLELEMKRDALAQEIASMGPAQYEKRETPSQETTPPPPAAETGSADNDTPPDMVETAAPVKATPPAEVSTQSPPVQPGTAPPSVYSPADRPKPSMHITQIPLSKKAMTLLLAKVDPVWALPKRDKLLIAGRLSKGVQDTAGIDVETHEYVAKPGQTAAGIARLLTGDETRAPELLAANPFKDPNNPRWRIPPSYQIHYASIPSQTMVAEETGATPKDGKRQPLTQRQYTVRQGEPPYWFALRVGAVESDQHWFRSLKWANPHKLLTPDSKNFVKYNAGEVLNYPDAWPPHADAVPQTAKGAPSPANAPSLPTIPGVPATPWVIPATWPAVPGFPQGATAQQPPPGPAPSGGQPPPPPMAPTTADPPVIMQSQGILAYWAKMHPASTNPIAPNFGTQPDDVSGNFTHRTRATLQYFQMWWPQNGGTPLRLDGYLDQPTYKALNDYIETRAQAEVPQGTVPYVPKGPMGPYEQPYQVPAPGTPVNRPPPPPWPSTQNASSKSEGDGAVIALPVTALAVLAANLLR